MKGEKALLEEQKAYYRSRAPEYDDWFRRRGRYDLSPEHKARWDAEVEVVRAALAAVPVGGSILELACGTGWWTSELALRGVPITAVDSSPEVLALNRERVGDAPIRYIEADVFEWSPPERFDTVFFSFWLSHVPPSRFDEFWELIERCLRPGGRVFFVDGRKHSGYAWPVAPGLEKGETHIADRELSDGRRFQIVKVFHAADRLTRQLRGLGWSGDVRETSEFFIWGEVRRREVGSSKKRTRADST